MTTGHVRLLKTSSDYTPFIRLGCTTANLRDENWTLSAIAFLPQLRSTANLEFKKNPRPVPQIEARAGRVLSKVKLLSQFACASVS